MIKLEETETEYMVAIPAAQRERAKRIKPRYWHIGRQRWVYPRESQIYDALVAEFAEDAAVVEITHPDSTSKPDLAEENRSLRIKLEELSKSLALIKQSASEDRDLQLSELKDTLAEREQTIEQQQGSLKSTQNQLVKSEHELSLLKSRLQVLEEQAERSETGKDFEEQLKDRALDATGGDNKFHVLVNQLSFNQSLPIELAKAMGSEFRIMLDYSDPDYSIYDLLREASDADALPNDAIDLAHLIRKQRNIVAHHHVHQKTYQARMILCLFAAALLWPEFPE